MGMVVYADRAALPVIGTCPVCMGVGPWERLARETLSQRRRAKTAGFLSTASAWLMPV